MELTKPLGYYTNSTSLRFHMLDVGEGLMILIIFPNDQVMLFDCNVTDDNEHTILDYLSANIPFRVNPATGNTEQFIDIFVNSHRDEDHYRGLKKINTQYPIQSIWDSGQTGATTQSHDYEYYMGLRRRLKEKDENNLKVLVPTDTPVATFNGVEIFCFAGKEDFQSGFNNGITVFKAATKIQHTNSIVLKISYGGRALLLTGDSDWESWKEKIIPNFEKTVRSDILVASHHGSRSFFTDEANDTIDMQKNPDTTYMEAIEYIDPDVTLISCGKYETYHHPNKEAESLYKKYSSYSQVYSTNNFGHLLGFISSNGNYTVVPSRFCEIQTAARSMSATIECTYSQNGEEKSVPNGSNLCVGGTLHFKLKTAGGIIEPIEKILVVWEVSNGGIGTYSSHQEIYFKGQAEDNNMFTFSRELSYYGTHLLRCKISNAKKGAITRIFKVVGV